MELGAFLFPEGWWWWQGLVLLGIFAVAIRWAPWARLAQPEQMHVFMGSCVVLMLLWHLQAKVHPGLSFHLLGTTALTLMFGWCLGILGTGLALLGVCLNKGVGVEGFVINALLNGVMPVTLTYLAHRAIQRYLPRHFFIYVLVNGFLTAGLVGVVTGYAAVALLVGAGAYPYQLLQETFVPFFPLMFLPEAMLNGWILTILVAVRPHWVGSFSDELYLKGK